MADFFDKMIDGFSKGVASVSTGSKSMIEKTKINAVIKNIEDEKKQLAEILGNKVYQMCVNDPECVISKSDVIDICGQITLRNQQIEEQRKKIADLDAEMSQVRGNQPINVSSVCPCGYQNAPGAKFCAKCGNKLL